MTVTITDQVLISETAEP